MPRYMVYSVFYASGNTDTAKTAPAWEDFSKEWKRH